MNNLGDSSINYSVQFHSSNWLLARASNILFKLCDVGSVVFKY